MPVFRLSSHVEAPAADVFAWFERPGAFERLTPPWDRMRVVERVGAVRDGDRVVLDVAAGPVHRRWEAVHSEYVPGRQFVDEMTSGPLRSWVHRHRFSPEGDGTLLSDEVSYELPIWMRPAGRAVRTILRRQFRYRHDRVRADIARQREAAHLGPQRFVVTGASGLIGRFLVPFLTTAGHTVVTVGRSAASDVYWDPERGDLDANALEGADVVVHLAGENIGAKRWSDEQKQRVLDSRVRGTGLLSRTLASLHRKPHTLLSASAIGFYGDRGSAPVDESAGPGDGFLSEVCLAWEGATAPAADAGIRVVNPRMGIVLTPAGGALGRLLLPFRLGLGGPVGPGSQWMSWIAMDDVVGAFHHLALLSDVAGAVNLVAPNPVTNREFGRTLAHVLHRPAIAPLPAPAIRLAFGEMGERLLLDSARVMPVRLVESHFVWRTPQLQSALHAELGR